MHELNIGGEPAADTIHAGSVEQPCQNPRGAVRVAHAQRGRGNTGYGSSHSGDSKCLT